MSQPIDPAKLLSRAPDGIFALNSDGACMYMNAFASDMLGFAPEEVLGRNMHALVHHHFEDGRPYPPDECPIVGTLRTGHGMRSDNEIVWRKDGTPLAVEYATEPLLEGGRVAGVVVSIRDISERKLIQRRLELQYAVAQSLSGSRDFAEVAVELLGKIGSAIGWGHGALWLVDGDENVLRLAHIWSEQAADIEVWKSALAGSELVRNQDIAGEVWASAEPAARLDESFGSRLAFPVATGQGVLGVIEFATSRLLPAPAALLVGLSAIGSQIAQFLKRRSTEDKLRASETVHRSVLETALDAIIGMDEKGRVVEWNPAAETMFDIARHEAIGRSMSQLIIPPSLRERHTRGLAHYLATGEGKVVGNRIEIPGLRRDGSEFPVELSVTRVPGEGPALFTGFLRDITSQKQINQDLERAKDAAEAASRAKSDFLASMSHELRTPLNAIIGYSEMLQEEAQATNNTSAGSDLAKIHTAGKHLLGLINDLLDLSKIEAGKMDLYLETFSLPDLVQEAAAMARPLIEKNGNSLHVEVDDELGTMYADTAKVRQSLLNLLSNAAKFTDSGMVAVSAKRDDEDGSIVLRVSDTGIGIPAEQLQLLFQSFQQVASGSAGRFGGTGLGLALTRRFCELMGGSVNAESEPGTGSVFTIRLPRRVASERAHAYSHTQQTGSQCTVLIIDDDPVSSDLLRRLLERDGFDAQWASAGEEGLRLARELKPAAITLDVIMPRMDGWEVLSQLKADPQLRDIPVIMLTMVDNRSLGHALGASEYLVKPVDRERLATVLARYRCERRVSRVLVVDDDEGSRRHLRPMLEKEHWQVSEAVNGREALAKLDEVNPDVILLDLLMPEMDGWEFAQTLAGDPRWSRVPIIVLTAMNLTAEDRARLNGSVARVLRKSDVGAEQIVGEIRRAVTAHPRRLDPQAASPNLPGEQIPHETQP